MELSNFALALLAVLGVLVGGLLITLIAPLWNAWLEENPARIRHLAKRGFLGFMSDQIGGYVHDTGFTQWISPLQAYGDTAAWTYGAGQVANSFVYKCDATDEVANLFIPITIPSNSAAQKGCYLTSIEVDFEILIAALDVLTPVIYKMTRGADGADVTVATPAFTYDTGHDSAAERIDVDEHKMTLTITTPGWVDNDEYYWLKLPFDKAATSTVEYLGAFANYTMRA